MELGCFTNVTTPSSSVSFWILIRPVSRRTLRAWSLSRPPLASMFFCASSSAVMANALGATRHRSSAASLCMKPFRRKTCALHDALPVTPAPVSLFLVSHIPVAWRRQFGANGPQMGSAQRSVHRRQLGLKLLPAREQWSELRFLGFARGYLYGSGGRVALYNLLVKGVNILLCLRQWLQQINQSLSETRDRTILGRVTGQGLNLGALGLSRQDGAGAFRKHCRQVRCELKLLREGTCRYFHSRIRRNDQRLFHDTAAGCQAHHVLAG